MRRDPRDNMRWVWRLVALGVLLVGWIFIAWQNHFHVTAPMVFVCLAFLAVVATVYNLWRTGASAVAPEDEADDSTWLRPTGMAGELEREKRTLLKAIKEAEFDHEMGKLSKRDADDMIATYRARAIEVIKELDRLALGSAGNVRQQIMREVRARLEVESAKAPKKQPADAKQVKKSKKADARPEPTIDAKPVGDEGGPGVKPATASAVDPEAPEPAKPADVAGDVAGDVIDEDAMNADSTTTAPRKEATP